MERIILEHTGWEHALRYERDAEPPPSPGPNEVVVQVGACGVAHRDLIDRSGRMKFMALPIVQGHEFAGRVLAVGTNVTRFSVGQHVGAMHRDHCGQCPRCEEGETGHCGFATHVFGIIADGGYASHVRAPESAFYPLPDDLAPAHGAVLNSTFGTAFRGLNRFITPQPGSTVLITGANGGVGLAAIQIAKRQGANVVAVVRAQTHVAFVESLGADHVIVDDGNGFHRKLPGAAADVVLDCVGSPTFNSSLRSARLGGALAVVGNVSEEPAKLNMGRLVVGDVQICGSSGASHNDMAEVLALHARAPFAFQIADELPLADADAAQRRLRAGGLQGRLVLIPDAT